MQDGRSERFVQLYDAHVEAVWAYARSRTSPDRAVEVVEETFVAAWRRFDRLPAEPRPWLFGIARGILSNQRRATERQAALHLRAVDANESRHVAPDHADQVVERDRVLGALAELREADREVLCLSAWGHLTSDEMAEVLGCTKAALAVRLYRARKRFEAFLDGEDRRAGGGPEPDPGALVPSVVTKRDLSARIHPSHHEQRPSPTSREALR